MDDNYKGVMKNNFTFLQFLKYIKNSSDLRIRKFIRSLARDYGREMVGLPGFKCIPFQLSNVEIAELTSTNPRRVNEVITNLKNQGVISFFDKKLLIKI